MTKLNWYASDITKKAILRTDLFLSPSDAFYLSWEWWLSGRSNDDIVIVGHFQHVERFVNNIL